MISFPCTNQTQVDLCLAVSCLKCWDDHEDQPKRPELPAIEGYTAHEAVGFPLSKTGLFPISILKTENNENSKNDLWTKPPKKTTQKIVNHGITT